MKRIIYIIILYPLFFISCLKDEPLKLSNNGFTPVEGNDDWSISTLKSENIDSTLVVKAFEHFYSKEELPMSKSLLIIRNGKLVAEAYAKDKNDINEIDNTQSCTKSVVSLLVGIAINKNLIPDVNQSLFSYFPEHFDANQEKRNITIRDCLTMEIGLEYKGGDDSEELVHTKMNSLKFVLEKPLVSKPGSSFLYSDFSPQLVNGVIAKATGQSVQRFAEENLFNPLNITNYKWETSKDGLNLGAFSLYLRPRDLAKLGQLCLQNGIWNNKVIVRNWIEQATIKQSKTSSYGYFFWLNPSLNSYSMEGNGRQLVFVCPAKNLVIVHTAFPYTSIPLWGDLNPVINNIYQACK